VWAIEKIQLSSVIKESYLVLLPSRLPALFPFSLSPPFPSSPQGFTRAFCVCPLILDSFPPFCLPQRVILNSSIRLSHDEEFQRVGFSFFGFRPFSFPHLGSETKHFLVPSQYPPPCLFGPSKVVFFRYSPHAVCWGYFRIPVFLPLKLRLHIFLPRPR